jgi:Pentapeptide repeats (9 copies)
MIPNSPLFEDQELDGRDFSGQCLIRVTFRRCRIRRANFADADLSYSVFEECDLYETKFPGAVLYFCRFLQCDATKADFANAYLNGIRVRETDITHATFGNEMSLGKNRKSVRMNEVSERFLRVSTRDHLPIISRVEEAYDGIVSLDTETAFRFVTDQGEQSWRLWRRRAEVAKTIERLLIENGYKDRSLSMYYLFRYYSSRAKPNKALRWSSIFAFEWCWGYGVKVARPILTWTSVAVLCAVLYALFPYWRSHSGVGITDRPLVVMAGGSICWACVSEILLFSFQLSTLSIFGSAKPVGLAAEWLAMFQQLAAVVMLGFAVATLARRIGNI